jgi:methylated-DNA-protein-cysteine methyltransferase-like protein
VRTPATTYQRIYAVVRRIPLGCVSTYGRVAIIARASGPRQVGYALHALRDDASVPWHRVVNAAGRISVGGASAVTQRLKLHGEGVEFSVGGRIDLERFGWVPAKKKR